MKTILLRSRSHFLALLIKGILPVLVFCSCIAGNENEKDVQVVYSATATIGEGAIWHPNRQTLFWVDIEGKTLYEYLPEKKDCRLWTFNRMVSTIVPESDTTVLVALQNEIMRVNLTTGLYESVVDINDQAGTLRCNDGKCDPEGRFWIGTMCMNAPAGTARLYCITPEKEVVPKIEGVTISNGLVWSADNRWMYYIDTPTKQIARYRYNASTAEIIFDGIAVTIPAGCGSPDGMTIDTNGNLWVAHWGGFGVYCWDPHTGALLDKIDVPAANVASCAFGGEQLDVLYITTARAGISAADLEKYPQSGSLFACKPGAKGVKANFVKMKK